MNNLEWSDAALFYEYTSAVTPEVPSISARSFPASLHQTGKTRIIPLDFSTDLKTPYPLTSPNLLAHFLRLVPGENLETRANASSHLFYVMRGTGETESQSGTVVWSPGDVFVLPASEKIIHHAAVDAALYWVNDSPLFNYLGAKAVEQKFRPILYTRNRVNQELYKTNTEPAAEKRSRNGVLLGNPDCPITKTATPSLRALYNILPAGKAQRPHRHNSVAVDFYIEAAENTYTLFGRSVDEGGNIVNPQKIEWSAGSVFVTPPGWWHSHHNESKHNAVVLAVQDAGLMLNMQVLDLHTVL